MNTPYFNTAIAETDLNALAITAGSSVTAPTAIQPYTLGEWMKATKTGKVKFADKDITRIIESIRREADKDKRNKLKMNLPYVCGAVMHTKRASENVTSNSVMIFDLDKVKDIEAMKNAALKLRYVYAAFRSPYDGVKLIVPLAPPIADVDTYKNIYAKISADITAKLEHPCDNTNDPARACYMSYDPDLLLNPDCTAIHPAQYEQQPQKASQTPRKAFEAPLLPSTGTGNSLEYQEILFITEKMCKIQMEYNDWIKYGMGLKAVLGMGGLAMWHLWLQNPHYQDTKAELDNKWRSFGDVGASNLGSLHYLANKYQISISALDSDGGMCMMFFRECGKNHRYVPGRGWYHWNLSHWEDDFQEVCLNSDLHKWKEGQSQKVLNKLSSNKHFKDVKKYASTFPSFIMPESALDKDKNVLAVENGVLVFRDKQIVLETDENVMRDYCLTKSLKFHYDKQAACPIFEETLQQTFEGNTDLIHWLQMYFGCMLLGDVKEKILIFDGNGANGKSTLINVLLDSFGQYGAMIDPTRFVAKNNNNTPFDPPCMKGARLLVGNEMGDNICFSEDAIKRATSTGYYPLNVKNKPQEMIPVTWGLIMSTNNVPRIDFTSDAIRRRLVLIPFKRQFLGENANQNLANELRTETPGILNWILYGAEVYLCNDSILPEPPDITRIAFESYEEDKNPVYQFVLEMCEVSDSNERIYANVYDAYKNWMEKEQGRKPLSKQRFTKAIEAITVHNVKLTTYESTTDNNTKYIKGIALKV